MIKINLICIQQYFRWNLLGKIDANLMQHFRGKLLGLVAADVTKLINKDKCTETTNLYNRIVMNFFLRNKGLLNDANLETKF